ncbi:phosphoglycerate mutase-like protein, partial [Amanita rubescens]
IYNSSDNEYAKYNWCNMPHVRQLEYITPPDNYTLEYVEVIQRHHKRTPYSSNTFFVEDIGWSCDHSGPVFGAIIPNEDVISGAEIQAYTDAQNPWTTSVGPGFSGSTCQFPQLTVEGLDDAFVHGQDLREVYFSRLGIDSSFEPSKVRIRVTNNVITSQVATTLLRGLFPYDKFSFPCSHIVYTQPSLRIPCPVADSLINSYTSAGGPNAVNWTNHLAEAQKLYAALDNVSGIQNPDNAGWHTSFDHYYDNLSAKESLNDTSLCVTREQADTVYRIGNWEYSYMFRDAPESTAYSALHYGAWVRELQSRLENKMNGSSELVYVHNIAHDGSIAPLLGMLQIAEMVWPGMGSEVVFELYSSAGQYYIRVLWSGQPIVTSLPLGKLDMIPINDFFNYINQILGTSGDALFNACQG